MATPIASANVISDGTLRFKIQPAAGGEPRECAIDVLLLRMTCEECELAHKLPETVGADGAKQITGTVAFFQDLAKRLQALGVDGCTPSIASQLWKNSAEAMNALKKNTSEPPSLPSGSTSHRRAKGRMEKSRKRKG